MKKEIKGKLHKLREKFIKEQKIDFLDDAEPQKDTIDFILRKFINWIEENNYEI